MGIQTGNSYRTNLGARGRLLPAGLLVLLVVVVLMSIGPRANAADTTSFDAPDATEAVWIDVEASNHDLPQISGELVSDSDTTTLTFVSSPTGMTAIVPNVNPSFALELGAVRDVTARVAVTFVDTNGTILKETSQSASISAQGRTVIEQPKPVETAKPAKKEPGKLAMTGAVWSIATLIVAVLLTVAGVFLWSRRGVEEQG